MPALTIGAAAIGTIPARTGFASEVSKPRNTLILTLISGDGYFSWKSSGFTTDETPLTVGVPIVLSDVDCSAAAYIYSGVGAVVNYTEFPPR